MKIKIHDYTWKVIFATPDTRDADYDFACGQTFKPILLIVVDNNLDEQMVIHTIIHELTHAYIWSCGLQDSLPLNEEQLCNFMETYSQRIMTDTEKIYLEYKKLAEKKKPKKEIVFELDKNMEK